MATGQCRAMTANGRKCRRKARTRDGLCGKCHAITEKGSQCRLSAKGRGEYCLNWVSHYPDYAKVARAPARSGRASARTVRSGSGANLAERKLSQRLRSEAAKICADAMMGSSFEATIRSQLIGVTSEKIVDSIADHWHGSRCEELAATARRLLNHLCFIDDRDLSDCSCMLDLVKFEGLEALGRLLSAGVQDWREILNRAPVAIMS